jgi:hypothetical protein
MAMVVARVKSFVFIIPQLLRKLKQRGNGVKIQSGPGAPLFRGDNIFG